MCAPSACSYVAWPGHESSLPYSDIESDSMIHMSLRVLAAHLIGWAIIAWMHQKSSYLPMCLSSCSSFDLNSIVGDTKQFSVTSILSLTDFAAHFGFGLDLLLAVLRVIGFDSSLSLRFATQEWHLAVPCSRF